MQYSTLRTSTLFAILSSSAFAYLDCGGGRAPPKTTVPGCPGYVDPATVVPTLTTELPIITTTTSYPQATGSASGYDDSWNSDYYDTNYNSETDYYVNTVTTDYDSDDGCICSGYLCEFAEPGCVEIDMDTGARSTITANPGWLSKTVDVDGYLSYIKTASAGGIYSYDGFYISMKTELPTESGKQTTKTKTTSATPTLTESPQTTLVKSTVSSSDEPAQASSTASTSASTNGTMSANATAPAAAQTSVVTADVNGASKVGLTSLAALLVSGAVAVTFL